MGIRKKIREMHLVCWLLVFCLLPLSFPRVVHAAPTDDVTLAVDQVFTQAAGSPATDTFTYTLTELQAGNPMPSGSIGGTYTFTITGNSTESIGPITYATAGTYSYEIEQSIASAQTGYTYDRQVYTMDVYAIVDSGGDMHATAIIYNDGGLKVSAVSFANAYVPLASDPAIMVDPPVKKQVVGFPSKDGTFTFKLEAENKSNPMPTGSKNGVKLMTIIGPGEEDFGTWSYTSPGTYHYTVSEVDNQEKNYIYDKTIYTITDVVTDVGGQLTVDRTVTNMNNKPVGAYDFVNRYPEVEVEEKTPDPKDTKKDTTTTRTNTITRTNNAVTRTTNSTAGRVKTGDDTVIKGYQVMLLLGGIGLIACMVYLVLCRRKQSTKGTVDKE